MFLGCDKFLDKNLRADKFLECDKRLWANHDSHEEERVQSVYLPLGLALVSVLQHRLIFVGLLCDINKYNFIYYNY